MAVIKNTPRYLKIDDDNKIIQPSEMPDALNIRVTEDVDGNSGVIKNIPSNAAATLNLGYSLGTNKVVGTYEHEGTNRLFVFVWNSLGVNTVYEMNQGDSGFTKIIESSNILLSGEHLHIDGMVIDDDLHIYFTDGVNEPQKINVDSGHTLGTYPSSQNEAAVMKVAPWAPTVEFRTDTSRDSNEIIGKSFQFALQYVYRDGEVSAIGEYSANSVSLNTLYNNIDGYEYKKVYNKIEIGIGGGTLGLGLGTTIPRLRLFFRDVYENTMYYVGEFTYTELFNKVDFYNDGSYSVVSDAEYNKMQDAVPKKASAQTIAANRLMFANYTEGFNKPTSISSSLSTNLGLEPKAPELNVTAPLANYTDIDTTNAESIINGTSDIDVLIKFRIKGFSDTQMIIGSDSSVTSLDLLDLSGTVVDTSTSLTFSYNINEVDLFKEVTVSSPVSQSDYDSKLISLLDGMKVTTSAAPYGGSTAVFSSVSTSIRFSGSVVLQATATAVTGGIRLTWTPVDFDLSSTAVIQGGTPLVDRRVEVSKKQSLTGSLGSLYVGNNLSNMFIPQGFRTFKAGDSHSFGIVFEDRYGRTSGVQEIGSVTVPALGDRKDDERGAAAIDITVSATGVPSELTHFFYVYSGGNEIEDYIQYTATHAFVSKAATDDVIYINMRSFSGKEQSYTSRDGADMAYNYADGDKFRIISYIDDNGVKTYPKDYVFDIIGVENITDPAFFKAGHGHSDFESTGDFIKLSNVSASGFDYNSVSNFQDLWNNNVLAEAYSPKKENSIKIYRAIEGKYEISQLGTTHTVNQGNAWYKQRNCKVTGTGDSLVYNLQYVESKQYNDFDSISKGDLGGKPYAVIANEREQSRISSVTYSDPQFADSAQTNLSSFNNSLANFVDYEMNYGGIYGLVDSSDSIMLLQSDKVSRVPVSRQILSTATGNSFVTQSTDVLGLQQHYQGNFGINEDRSAFLKADGDVYLVDVTRSKLIAITPQGVSEISEEGVSSWVEGRCNSMLEDPQGYFISIGNDKDNKEVIFSLQNKPISNTKSIIFSKKLGKFTSFVSYTGSYYGNLGNRFFQIRDNNAYEAEKGTTYGNFFGTQNDASFTTVFNSSPSTIKVFQALSMESNRPADITIETAKNSATIDKNTLSEREDAWYGYIPRSEGSSEYMILGVVAAEDDPKITFSSRVSRIPFRIGGDAYVYSNGSYIPLNANVDGIIDSNSLSFTNAGAISVGDVIAIKSDSRIDGDAVRGHYAKVQYVLDDSSKFEVFAVNASVAQSSLNNNGGSQQ